MRRLEIIKPEWNVPTETPNRRLGQPSASPQPCNQYSPETTLRCRPPCARGDRLDIQGAVSRCVGLNSSAVRSGYALGDTGNTGGLGRVVCWLAILLSVALCKSNGILPLSGLICPV